LDRALDSTWALDIAIYEFELPEVAELLEKARQRGTQIRVIYHAKEGDEQTEKNIATLEPLKTESKLPRQTNAIFHHKFCVLSRVTQDGRREPQAVLTGSTNFTPNGVYRQANVVHIMEDKAIGQKYLDLFEELFQGADPKNTKSYINKNHPVKPGSVPQAVFSPRSKFSDIQEVVDIVQKASRDLVFCTTFNLHSDLCQALLGTPESHVIRYGLQNSRTKITGTHRFGQFVATAMLKTGLEGFLKEATVGQKGNILVHLKTILTDFSTDNPTVITGSNNFSANASSKNDENMLIIGGKTPVADVYVCEMMRLYDHYRLRYNRRAPGKRGPRKRLTLYDTDEWAARYYEEGTLPCLERIRFSGGKE
jgi:phosphatidylserine/phosphatidylglycerophosphate/cardiolipin synthase-like enzyme